MNFTTVSLYYVHCIKTRSSIMNGTITTPFWSNKTTTSDTLSSMSETSELGIMVSMIGVMFMMIILYAAVCRLCSSEKYHDSLKQAIFHIALTLLTYFLYLFDTLSDVFLLIHYCKIGEYLIFFIIMVFTVLPVLFIATYFYGKGVGNNITKYCETLCATCVHKCRYFNVVIKMLSVFMSSLYAVILPTLTYAQALAQGKQPDRNLEYTVAYLTLVEATVESTPQLTIQIYLSITNTQTETTQTQIIRYMSIAASSLGLAWSLNAFKHQYRKTKQNQEDRFLIKFIHWISRFAEIVPRIILISLFMAEYSYLVLILIIYRVLNGLMFVCCKEHFLLDDILGLFGNIFCYSVSRNVRCQKKEYCGGYFFPLYYILYYAENVAMLYLWYSDDPALLKIKIALGGACSNHEWYAPCVFVVVVVGFVVQPSLLLVYYRLRKKQHKPKDTNTSE
ncbi:uncharacterized protein LOC127705157 [Mytilus californianus]|uniref:uncharacterized protein LOC127705157 n=1 Tax=Mytilus californianus TaxID=6549 RepID=UPI0022455D88|nr:uncharacterized protein LOC127705157 [Mytilus californianus]